MKKRPQPDALHVLWSGDARAIEQLLHSKVDLNHADPEGRTLLMEAVLEKRADLVKLLLDAGADATLHDRSGSTALHYAAQGHLADVVQLLLGKGVPVDPVDHQGDTPLFKALSTYRGEANGDAIWALMLAGANPKLANTHGVSPEDLARRPSNYDLGQFFR